MAAPERYVFGPFTLDAAQHVLLRGPHVVDLPPKALEALLLLVRNAGRVVSREVLRETLWPDTWVSDNTLYQKIWLLRKVLEHDGLDPAIETLARNGYRLVLPVRRLAAGRAEAATCWVFLGEHGKHPLREGENTLGRGDACDVVLDLGTISRTHARITVEDGRITLEDVGSKNGTFLNERRVEKPVLVQPGDAIRLGDVRLEFRTSGRRSATKTVS